MQAIQYNKNEQTQNQKFDQQIMWAKKGKVDDGGVDVEEGGGGRMIWRRGSGGRCQ